MRRREFILALGGAAAAWPLAAGAQPAMPVVGFLRSSRERGFGHLVAAFRQGLSESGYTDGSNVMIEFRWGDDNLDRLSALAADLVRRDVTVIVANYGSMAAAMAATKTIPIVFVSGEDPVTGGLVANLHRPGGNVTGVSFFDIPLSGKRLGLLNELVPRATIMALLLESNFVGAKSERQALETAAQAMGRQIVVIEVANEGEFDGVSATIARSGAGALLVGGGPFFIRQRRQLVALVARHAIPAIYVLREYVEAGGLMSYGASQTHAYRRSGAYVSRILKGDKPGDLPVELPSKFELVINLATGKGLALTIPPGVLAIADEVIE
jgi:putative ABC transport system substrate-binding protein